MMNSIIKKLGALLLGSAALSAGLWFAVFAGDSDRESDLRWRFDNFRTDQKSDLSTIVHYVRFETGEESAKVRDYYRTQKYGPYPVELLASSPVKVEVKGNRGRTFHIMEKPNHLPKRKLALDWIHENGRWYLEKIAGFDVGRTALSSASDTHNDKLKIIAEAKDRELARKATSRTTKDQRSVKIKKSKTPKKTYHHSTRQ